MNYRGIGTQPTTHVSAESVAYKEVDFRLEDLAFCDPDYFIAGNVHNFYDQWLQCGASKQVLEWIRNGINVFDFFRHFKGNYRGKAYDSDIPPSIFFPNSEGCKNFVPFIVSTLLDRLANGSLKLVGKVGVCEPPLLVLPLTVEPNKPRLCHDERYLNCWVKDNPFSLETLRDLPRLLDQGDFMASLDDKSGYDHVLLSTESRKFFGIQFGGYYMVFNTLPFGFKASAFIYQKIGLVATGYCRLMGVPCLQYIDDRWIGAFMQSMSIGGSKTQGTINVFEKEKRALRSLYIVCEVLIRLGYFINILKSVFIPVQLIKFLGMLVDSNRLAFIIPQAKLSKFKILRESILAQDSVDLLSLQKFAGKCISFLLAIPSAKLYIKEVNRAISVASKNSGVVTVSPSLREEIIHWSFLDSWEECFPWRKEKHLQISLVSDASKYKWGALVFSEQNFVEFSDFWKNDDSRPIHLKEANALVNALNSVSSKVRAHRVDAYVDNLACVYALGKF